MPSVTTPRVEADVAKTLQLGSGARIRRILGRVIVLALAAAAAGAVVQWWRGRGQTTPPQYKTAAVTRGELAVTVTATGMLEARNVVTIGSEVSGRIDRVLVDANDPVKKGQILAELNPEMLEAQAEQARAQLLSARAQVASADATTREATIARKRIEKLVKEGLAAEAELDAARAAAERANAASALARAAVAQAQAALRVAETNLGRVAIKSPVDGIVLMRSVEVGQTVVASFQAPVLFQIAEDLKAMRVSADVDEADVGMVKEGQSATFTVAAYLDRQFPATVVKVHNAARLVDRVVTYETELDVDNRDLALRPGMTVTAEIITRKLPDELQVPSQALRFTPKGEDAPAEGETRIWVLHEHEPVAVKVETLASNDTSTAVRATGLAEGDPVIVDVK